MDTTRLKQSRPGARLRSWVSFWGHQRTVVCELLHELNFSLQANCKIREGDSHPDRDAQFCYINDLVKTALIEQQPVISVDKAGR
jgi:hypothetical protein